MVTGTFEQIVKETHTFEQIVKYLWADCQGTFEQIVKQTQPFHDHEQFANFPMNDLVKYIEEYFFY